MATPQNLLRVGGQIRRANQAINFRDVVSFRRPESTKNDINVKPELLNRINVIWGVQIARKKYSDFQKSQISLYP
jgi:hypothetical protein